MSEFTDNPPQSKSGRAPLTPSVRLLFSLVPKTRGFLLLLPAIVSSIVSGCLAPYMTYVIGQAFDKFAQFPLSPNPPQASKDALLRGVGISALELVGLAAGTLVLSSITSCLWIWAGEYNVLLLRKKVYESVMGKEMMWFDAKMGEDESVVSGEGDRGPTGAGGLMAQFARETEDVRTASSLASGMLIQHLTTVLACLILAFTHSWSLTFVILAAVPILIFIQGVSEALVTPPLASERTQIALASTLVNRAVEAIATVKAFNASSHEQHAFDRAVENINKIGKKCYRIWGITSGSSQFVAMAMFVQGFWFGGKLVRSGEVSVRDVMAVFWACLIATSNLQLCIPQLILLTKGKSAMASLLDLADASSHRNGVRHLKKISPATCNGELAMHNVTFSYPSRPTIPVLQEVSLYLPANETTFIVGGSGSGKSTIAQLLLRMYDPQGGTITLDNQDLTFLDKSFTRHHLAGVSQSCILFDMSVHDNVAIGGVDGQASKEEVLDACRVALMHEFVKDLPEGYETKLGNGGANLSGGQRQRLAIARAKLRNPSILVLDEATSALDATSRLLVFEAIKRWRANKTTIVITHDLSQITSSDFVYVLKNGRVAEQGYRHDLEQARKGHFREMMDAQATTGGFLPEKGTHSGDSAGMEEGSNKEVENTGTDMLSLNLLPHSTQRLKHDSLPLSILRASALLSFVAPPVIKDQTHLGQSPKSTSTQHTTKLSRRNYNAQMIPPEINASMQTLVAERYMEKELLTRSGMHATSSRPPSKKLFRNPWIDPSTAQMTSVDVEKPDWSSQFPQSPPNASQQLGFWGLLREIYPFIPSKPVLFIGLVICIISGAITPVFSFLLSQLIFQVSIGAHDTSKINAYGAIVLGVAALDGICKGLKVLVMETIAIEWLSRIRSRCFRLLLSQDKSWFDKSEHSPVRLVQMLITDGDDARTLIATVLGQFFVVFAMLSVGLIWALVKGWQLTLVGFAIAPVFALTMAVQNNLVGKCEVRNKRAREEVGQRYHEAISNVRGIRSMAFERIFQKEFEKAVDNTFSTGVRGAFVEGCTFGVAAALIYLSEALLFYVGAVLTARGTYTYLQTIEVLDLVVFSVSIGSQMLGFTQKIAKAAQATRDFNKLLCLIPSAEEALGAAKPPIAGSITYNAVAFSYPERSDVPVLKNIDMDVADGECVAIVGASGSGKSTVAALLQRLYEPQLGSISIGAHKLSSMDITHLREHVAVVSQNPDLFDATISENISYGNADLAQSDIEQAAKAANVHDFIMSLPQGYKTTIGEGASLISGGQAQRLSIARALARPSKILILDECTSALDSSNQALILETIQNIKVGRTTLMVTHKLPVMQMCDRIIVIHEGVVAEQGTYTGLMNKKGVFSQLACGGEWQVR